MSNVLRIAADQWRHWIASRLALTTSLVFVVVLASVAGLTATHLIEERRVRRANQNDAEQRFVSQPDRHPHRMVHYGHYVFRPPAPLSVIDPGIDAVTGRALFLEGHRVNSATFAEAQASASAGGAGPPTTAFMYQVLLPLLLIGLGHGVVLRERETRTLATLLGQGVSKTTLVAGKSVALVSLVVVLAVPLGGGAVLAVSLGESWGTAWALVATYVVYLLLWAAAVLAASLWMRERRNVLVLLLGAWLGVTFVVPRTGVAVTKAQLPTPGQIERTLDAKNELRAAGDAHNPADPAFVKLRGELLAQHGVDKVEDLPINLRGVVAERSEAALSVVLDRYAEARMAREVEQEQRVAALGWLSPAVAVGAASRALSGTDLATYHRFLREAEAVRFEFVQGLNWLHATELAYVDDVQRSNDPAAERRTRVDAGHWASLLRDFRFALAEPAERGRAALSSWLMLLTWCTALLAIVALGTRRLSP